MICLLHQFDYRVIAMTNRLNHVCSNFFFIKFVFTRFTHLAQKWLEKQNNQFVNSGIWKLRHPHTSTHERQTHVWNKWPEMKQKIIIKIKKTKICENHVNVFCSIIILRPLNFCKQNNTELNKQKNKIKQN